MFGAIFGQPARINRQCITVLSALLLAGVSHAALAQSTGVQLDTINVDAQGGNVIDNYVARRSTSATKTDTPLIETPQAISVVGAEQIRDQRPAKFDEVARYSPGVFGAPYGPDSRNDWFFIRGFKADNDGIFLDGQQLYYYSYGSFKMQTFGLERVDLLRGPSSALFGSGNPGGIVNGVSKKPTVEPLRYMEVGINNFGNRYIGFDFSGPVVTTGDHGKIYYRLTGQAQAGATQIKHMEDDNYFIQPSVTWIPNIDTKLTIIAQAAHNNTKQQTWLPYQGTVIDAPFGRIPTDKYLGEPASDKWRRDQLMIGYQFEHSFNNATTFRQNARVAHVRVDYSSYYPVGYTFVPNGALTGDLLRSGFMANVKATQASLDNNLEYKFETGPLRHTALVGLDLKYYGIDDYNAFGAFGGAPPINALNPVYSQLGAFTGPAAANQFITMKQLGVYVQDQIKLDRFTLVLSGRHDSLTTDRDNRIGPSQNRSDGKFSWRTGLIYNFDNGLAPYASYATSFAPIVGVNALSGQLFFPETAKQYEVGLKYQPTFMNATFGVALFDLTRQNVQSSLGFPPTAVTQTGEIKSRGIELEAVLNPMPGLKITGAYTSYRFKTTNDLNPLLIDKTLTAVPQQFGSAWADYTFQDGPLRGFGFGGGIRYVGASYADTMNTLTVPSYTVYDATIHYERDGWRYAINAQNLADRIYVASCSYAAGCIYGDRLRVTGSVSYKW